MTSQPNLNVIVCMLLIFLTLPFGNFSYFLHSFKVDNDQKSVKTLFGFLTVQVYNYIDILTQFALTHNLYYNGHELDKNITCLTAVTTCP